MLTKEIILSKTTELNIFQHYIPNCNTSKNISSPFSEDAKPSFRIYKPNSGTKKYNYYTFKCNSTNKQGDCFQFVAYLKYLDCKKDFSKVLKLINDEMNLGLDFTKKEPSRPLIYKHKNHTAETLKYWAKLKVTKELLKTYNVLNVDSYEYLKGEEIKLFKVYTGLFAFDYEYNNTHEVYFPKQTLRGGKVIKKKFSKSIDDHTYIWGFEQLPEHCINIIICAGKKDTLTAIANGLNAVCFSSEASFPTPTHIKALKYKCDNLLICYDTDNNGDGFKNSSRISKKYNLPNIIIPPHKIEDSNDIALYIPEFGLEAFTQLINIAKDKFNTVNNSKIFIKNNSYYTKSKERGSNDTYDKQLTNFTINTIALISSKQNPRRIIQITTPFNVSEPLEFTTDAFISKNAFKKEIGKHDNYYFYGNDTDLNNITEFAFADSGIAKETIDLGFDDLLDAYILSNGILHANKFYKPDDYGIVYFNNNKGVYIPASSTLNKDEVQYIDSRKFKFAPSKITTEQWLFQMEKTYKNYNLITIPFLMAAIHFDIISKQINCFPLLTLFGPPRNGKSTMAQSLVSIFGIPITGTSLPNSTQPSASAKVAQFRNSIIHFDEFDNTKKCAPWVVPTLKGFFDLHGRSKKTFTNDNMSFSTPVKSASIVTGQEMPSDDSHFSRTIAMYIAKIEYSKELANNISDLEVMEEQGLGNVLKDLLSFRPLIKELFKSNYDHFLNVVNDYLKSKDVKKIQPRLLKSYATLLAVYEIYINNGFPLFKNYSLKDVLQGILNQVIYQLNLEKDNDELLIFWETIDKQIDKGRLVDKVDFKIDLTKDVLTFKASSFFDAYEMFFRQKHIDPVAKNSIISYMENEDYFITKKATAKYRINDFTTDLKVSASYKVVYSKLPVLINNIYKESAIVKKPVIQKTLYNKN